MKRDRCKVIDVDGEPVRVHGDLDNASPEAQAALETVIRAAREYLRKQEESRE